MKLSSFIVAFGLVGSISASPLALEKRQTSAPAAVSAIVKSLSDGAGGNVATIKSLVADVNRNVDASAAVAAAVTANLQGLRTAFETATKNLVAITTGAAGGVTAVAQGFGANQLDQLARDVQTIRDLVQGVSVTAALVVDNLAPAALSAVSAELTAAQAAVRPFVDPLNDLAAAVANANATAIVRVAGLRAAISGLVGIFTRFIGGLLGQ